MSIHAFKTRIDKVLTEAIEMNKDQIYKVAAEKYATKKYLVVVEQTLTDMQGRIHDEYVKQLKSTGEDDENN